MTAAAPTMLLIAYDGSEPAAAALQAAGRLFPGAKAIVLAVSHGSVEREPVPAGALTLAGPAVAGVRRSGGTSTRGIAERGCALACEAGFDAEAVTVPFGSAAREICRAARGHSVDLIVCGTHARSFPARAFLGSTASAVLHHARRPVLVVPPTGGSIDGPLVVAYDGSNAAHAAVRLAARLFGARKAIVVHVAGSPVHDSFTDDTAQEGTALARTCGLQASAQTVDATAGEADALLTAAHAADACAVVAGSRGLGSVGSMLLGSVSTGLVHDASLPVLIVNGRPTQA